MEGVDPHRLPAALRFVHNVTAVLAAVARALTPLTLGPLFVALSTVFTGALGAFGAFAFSTIALAVVSLIWLDGQPLATAAERRHLLRDLSSESIVIAFAIAVAAVAALAAALGVGPHEADWSRSLLFVSAVATVAAATARLKWLAATPLRGVLATTILAAVLLELWALLGAPGLSPLAAAGSFAVPAVLVLVVAAIETWRRPVLATNDNARRVGLACAFVGGLFFMVASVYGRYGETPTADLAGASAAGVVPPSSWLEPTQIARRFAPLLEFTADEEWMPVAVDAYRRSAKLRWFDGRPVRAGAAAACAQATPAPCFSLTIRCPVEGASEREPRPPETCWQGAAPPRGKPKRAGVAYARVVRAGDQPDLPYDVPVADVGPWRGRVATLVEYWLFYAYDDWHADTLFGHVRQAHEADWEAVTIGFSKTRPLFVALSAHCGGTWLRWQSMQVVRALGGLRPVVAVARGSHANYADAAKPIPPDWAGCAGLASDRVSAASLAYGVRDRTGTAAKIVPKTIAATVSTWPMNLRATWGENGVTRYVAFAGHAYPFARGRGPTAPPFHGLWRNPMRAIFCDHRWRPVGIGTPKTRDGCRRPKRKAPTR